MVIGGAFGWASMPPEAFLRPARAVRLAVLVWAVSDPRADLRPHAPGDWTSRRDPAPFPPWLARPSHLAARCPREAGSLLRQPRSRRDHKTRPPLCHSPKTGRARRKSGGRPVAQYRSLGSSATEVLEAGRIDGAGLPRSRLGHRVGGRARHLRASPRGGAPHAATIGPEANRSSPGPRLRGGSNPPE